MSHRLGKVQFWIEWSPNGVQATPAGGGSPLQADSLAGLKGMVAGPCVILLSRRSTFVKATRLPNARAADLEQIVAMQANQLFPTVSGPMTHGFLLTNDVNPEGRLAVLVAVSVATLERIYEEAKEAGIQIEGAIPVSLGATIIAHNDGETTAAIVESTNEGLAIDVVKDGALIYSRVTPTMGASNAKSEIARTFAAAGVDAAPTLGNDDVAGVDRHTSERCATAMAKSHVDWSTALLELPSAVEDRSRIQVRSRAQLAMLLAVACVGCAAIVYDWRDEASQQANKARSAHQSELQGWTRQRDATQTERDKFTKISEELKRAFEPKQPASDVIAAAGNLAPAGVWLTGVNYERGKDVQIRGVAMTNEAVKCFLETMGSSSRFRDVRLVFANNALIETSSVVQFSVSAHVVGNLPPFKTKQELKKR